MCEDVEYLINKIEEYHVDPYRYTKKDAFLTSLSKIKKSNEKNFCFALQESLALLRDSHTKVPEVMEVWGNRLPFQLREILGEYFITGTNKANETLLYKPIKKINGFSIDKISSKLQDLSSKEGTEMTIRDTEKLLISFDALNYFGFVNKTDVQVSTDTDQYDIVDLEGTINKARPFLGGLSETEFSGNEIYRYINLKDTVLFQYNSCNNHGHTEQEVKSFKEDLLEKTKEAKNIVVDLRQNEGGTTSIMSDLFEQLPVDKKIFVAMGRDTYSAAMHHLLYLKDQKKAMLIGENAGQKPNRFGDRETIILPNSGVEVFCSFKYFELLPGVDIEVVSPDIKIPLTIQDYISRTDPLLKWIEDNLS
jgi:hypothetical protein